jgi:predicted PurR-regulated permease PerM
MSPANHIRFWLIVAVVFFAGVWLLRDILLPFIVGMAIAYFMDPVCDRLEKLGVSRTLATTIVTVVFVFALLAVLGVILPIVAGEVIDLAKRLPEYWQGLREHLVTWAALIEDRVGADTAERLRQSLGGSSEKLVGWLTGIVSGVLSGGAALLNLASLVFITPVVAFFLLRDWDRIVDLVDSWLPRDYADTVRDLAHQVDSTLAGFVRGQALVCIILGTFYAVGLAIVGLDFGTLIGLGAGLVSFIPYVGAIVGFVAAVGLALVQFDTWGPIVATGAVFVVGQTIEGNVLTPKLVGERVGLHPVWVIFGLLAGGALFGFVGVLLSVPVAAVIGVGVRFTIRQYKASSYYRGTGRSSE